MDRENDFISDIQMPEGDSGNAGKWTVEMPEGDSGNAGRGQWEYRTRNSRNVGRVKTWITAVTLGEG